jgi:hypothetical protein
MSNSRIRLTLLILLGSLTIANVATVLADTTFGVTTTPTADESKNDLLLNQATLSTGGTLTSISFYCIVSGNVKVGLYADNSGSPGNLLVGPLTQTSCTPGSFNTVTVSGGPTLTAGTYWLADDFDTTGAVGFIYGGTQRYKSLSYGSAWPNPAGGGYVSYGATDAIYGTVNTGPPPSDFTITASPRPRQWDLDPPQRTPSQSHIRQV